ncbi:hypothetical protein AALP_AA6G238200 [Arabis alpina]|uniref:Retrotransposon gag domain-containing protein n=1 Tax=Arabis alpina TaxID=50452 RepID=A0A087GRA8_ARAAL|nr:hypothetical protein AALP_AA6G238200 [Arabis alpina]
MDHLEMFEDLAFSIKANNVSEDYIMCKLFPFSLAGEATSWLKQLEPGSLTTWRDTKSAFPSHFYDESRSEDLRAKISTFVQNMTECFKAAWERFKGYQRDCPHHGFTEVQLLGIFYRGMDWRHQMTLDASSNGNFKTRFPADFLELIKNVCTSNSTKKIDEERRREAGKSGGAEITEVKAKIDFVHNLLVNKKSIHFAQEVDTFYQDEDREQEDVNYINQNGYQNQRYGNQSENKGYNNYNQRSSFSGTPGSPSYAQKSNFQKPFGSNNNQRTYGSSSYQPLPSKSSESDVKGMIEQLLEGQQSLTVNLNGKIDGLYTDLNGKIGSLCTDLNGKIDALNIHMKKLDTQVAQTAENVKRQEGFLPARTDTNPRQHGVAAITTRSGKVVEPNLRRSNDRRVRKFPNLSRRYLDEGSTKIAHVDRCTDTSVDRRETQKTENLQILTDVVEKVYQPKIPYPRNQKRSKQELEDLRCKAIMDKLRIEIPFLDAMKLSPVIRRYVKRMVTKSLCVEEGVAMISEQVSAIILNKIPEKLTDPGSFVLDCLIFTDRFPRSLCDLGSSINLMPLSVAINLGMTDFQPTRISLILADRSVRIPEGILEDVPIKVGDCLIPTDFVVLQYHEEPKDPLILGRPFLATAGALIDVKGRRITLCVGDLEMKFDMDQLVKKPTIDGQTYYVDTLTDIAQEVFNETHPTDALERTLIRSIAETEELDEAAMGYARLMDSNKRVTKMVANMELCEVSEKIAKNDD